MNQKSGIHYNTPKIREQDKKTVGLILMFVILTVTQMKKKIFFRVGWYIFQMCKQHTDILLDQVVISTAKLAFNRSNLLQQLWWKKKTLLKKQHTLWAISCLTCYKHYSCTDYLLKNCARTVCSGLSHLLLASCDKYDLSLLLWVMCHWGMEAVFCYWGMRQENWPSKWL